MNRRLASRPLLAIGLLLAGCTGQSVETPPLTLPARTTSTAGSPVPLQPVIPPGGLTLPSKLGGQETASPEIVRGGSVLARPIRRGATGVGETDGDITLNFENIDIRSVVKAVLGETLQLPYTIDPAVQGTMNLHTAKPISRRDVLPSFEEALRLSGVALVAQGSGYEVMPLQDAAQRTGLDLTNQVSLPPGFHVELLPVRYVSAAEIQHVLEPLARPGTIIRVDTNRNLLVLSGTESELASLIETAAIFDVDWLKSESFGLFPLHYAQPKSVASDLEQVIGKDGPLAGLVRIAPIERLNAILVVSHQQAYVEEMRDWIDRFDHGGEQSTPRLYVYPVQNGRAQDLAGVLGKLLSKGGSSSTKQDSAGSGGGQASQTDAASQLGQSSSAALPAASPSGGASGSLLGDVNITADETNNAIITLATPAQYKLIEQALHQLDAVPMQVLLEAVVAEITLTNNLQYGLQYYLKKGNFSALQASSGSSVAGGSSTTGTTGTTGTTTNSTSLSPDPGGLSFAFSAGSNVGAVLDFLAGVTEVKVISSPEVLVLNNRTANLDVGDQVPVATSSAVSTETTGAPVVNTIQMQSTGIILKVTPRVNQGGLVLMDIDQEVSSSVPTTSSGIDSPTIQERKVSSSIAVQDGQTIALGGLISDTRTKSHTGIPWLGDVPGLGALFSTTSDAVNRTELLVLITPHVVRDQKSAQDVTDELRAKLPLMRGFEAPH
jgi:general secretion pathway protein D